MRRFILSENEIRNLVKRTLLKEEGENKTISQLQSLLASKGFTEVGTADGKAGPNTLSAINRALGLSGGGSSVQTNTSNQSTIKNPTRMLGAGNLSTTDYKTPQERIKLNADVKASYNPQSPNTNTTPENPVKPAENPVQSVETSKKSDVDLRSEKGFTKT